MSIYTEDYKLSLFTKGYKLCLFNRSNLYNDFIKNKDNYEKEENIKKDYLNELKKHDFTEEDVLNFLKNYEQIDYNKNNINKYIWLVTFFDYDIKDEFFKFLVKMFKNYNYDELIYDDYKFIITEINNLINNLKNKLEKSEKLKTLFDISNNDIFDILHNDIKKQIDDKKYYKYMNYVNKYKYDVLNININKNTTDNDIINLTNLTELDLHDNKNITDDCIKNMTCIRELTLRYNDTITDDGIKNMTCIQTLNLKLNKKNNR